MNVEGAPDDLATIYARLSQEQRAAIAQQFIHGIQHAPESAAQAFATRPPDAISAEELAALHAHARQHHGDLFTHIMGHPIATIALGSFAAHEIERYVKR